MTSEKIERLGDMNDYDIAYGTWDFNGEPVPVASQYRIAWRQMAATTGFRTMYPAMIPPGARHVNGIISAGVVDPSKVRELIAAGAGLSTILADFLFRAIGSHLWGSIVNQAPALSLQTDEALAGELYLRLNCLTSAYGGLWRIHSCESWNPDVPITMAIDRERAQARIDAAAAYAWGVTADELCMIYRTQFPVMRRYDTEDRYDRNGRRVPKEILRLQAKRDSGDDLSAEERTWNHPASGASYLFEYPFVAFDREAEMRAAYQSIEDSIASNASL